MDNTNAEKRMASAPIWRLFLNMSLPTILVMLVMVLYNMADIYFVGRSGSTAQVAALSLSGPIYGAMQGLGTLLGAGGCTAAALALGSGDRHTYGAITSFCFRGALYAGIAFALAGALYAPSICTLLGADAEAEIHAAQYIRILMLGAPFILISSALSNVIRSSGSMREAIMSNLIGTILNVVLDPLFIDVFSMGVSGAALATVLGNVASCIFIIVHVARKQPEFSFSAHSMRREMRTCLRVLALGLSLSVSTLLSSCSSMMSNSLLSGYGDTAVAAMGIAGKASMLVVMVAMGICMGIQPAISYCYGRGDIKRALSITRAASLVSFGICLLLGVGCCIMRVQFVEAFTNDAAVLALGCEMLIWSLAACPLAGMYQSHTTFLQATDKASYAILLSVLRQGVLYVPCLYILNSMAGLNGLIWAAPITDMLAFAISSGIYIKWKREILLAKNVQCT